LEGIQVSISDEEELVASVAPEDVAFPDDALQAICDPLQDGVAGGMALRIVDALESVQVEQQDGEPLIRSPRPLDRLVEFLQHVPAVVEPGQSVRGRQVRQRLDEAGVMLLERVTDGAHGPERQGEEEGMGQEEKVKRMLDQRPPRASSLRPQAAVQRQREDGHRDSPEEAEPEVDVAAEVVGERLSQGFQVPFDRSLHPRGGNANGVP
jgi:hypothetical protein